MPQFSRITIIEAVGLLESLTHADLDRFLLKYRLERIAPQELRPKTAKLNAVIKYLIDNPDEKGPLGANLTFEIIEDELSIISPRNIYAPPIVKEHFPKLVNSLKHDGYVITNKCKLKTMLPEGIKLVEKENELNSLGLATKGIPNKIINEKGKHVVAPEIPTTTKNEDKVYLFYSYSHDDERFRKRLEKHLSLLRRTGSIEDWHDRKIPPGAEINKEIDENLKKSQIILLLVSENFMNSDYAYDIEVKAALKKHESGEAIVIPIILDYIDWHDAPFGKLNALPRDGIPITSRKWKNQNEAFAEVIRGIRTNIKNLNKS